MRTTVTTVTFHHIALHPQLDSPPRPVVALSSSALVWRQVSLIIVDISPLKVMRKRKRAAEFRITQFTELPYPQLDSPPRPVVALSSSALVW